jgi:hypothetical protein
MNLTNKVLKLLGMKLAADMLEEPVPQEQKLFRAILTLALEDVLSNSQGYLNFGPRRRFKQLSGASRVCCEGRGP